MYKIYFKRLYFLILHAKFTLKMIFLYNWKLKFRDSFQSSFYAILPPPFCCCHYLFSFCYWSEECFVALAGLVLASTCLRCLLNQS